ADFVGKPILADEAERRKIIERTIRLYREECARLQNDLLTDIAWTAIDGGHLKVVAKVVLEQSIRRKVHIRREALPVCDIVRIIGGDHGLRHSLDTDICRLRCAVRSYLVRERVRSNKTRRRRGGYVDEGA